MSRKPESNCVGDLPECEVCGTAKGVRWVNGGFYCWECVEMTEEEAKEIRADERYHIEREEHG